MKAVVYGMLLCATCAAAAVADTVVLKGGSRLEGEVRALGSRVEVTTEAGTLTLPAWRVSRVLREAPAAQEQKELTETRRALKAEIAVEFEETPLPDALSRLAAEAGLELVLAPEARKAEQTVTLERRGETGVLLRDLLAEADLRADVLPDGSVRVYRRSAAPDPKDVLEQKIEVSFAGVSLKDALEQVRQLTGANLVIGPAVREDPEPVHLQLTDARVRNVLHFLLEPGGYVYAVKEDGILHVGRPRRVHGYELRVYPVTDLLIHTGDVETSTSRKPESRAAWPQFGGRRSYAGRDEDREAGRITLHQRTDDLMVLLRGTCARERWWFHGPGRRDND